MSIMESMNIGSNALKAHGLRLDIHAKNIANVDTPNYVRRIPVLNAGEDISFHGVMNAMKEDVFGTGTLPYLQGGVVFNGCVEDPTVGERIYSPGHPDADANGYVWVDATFTATASTVVLQETSGGIRLSTEIGRAHV